MRKLTSLMYLFVAATLLFTSCGGDEEDPTPTSPTFDFTASSAITNGGTITVEPGATVSLTISASKSDKNLSTISFFEGANLISDASRISINGEAQSENPVDLSGDDRDAFTWTVELTASTEEGSNNYTVTIEDKDELSSSLTFTVITTSANSDGVEKLYANTATASDAATVGSFYSTTNKTTYNTADAATNLTKVDFALNEPSNGTYKLVRPQDQATSNTAVKDGDATTVFSASSLSFDGVTKTQLMAATATATEIEIAEGSVYFFYNSETGVRGLINITSVDATNDVISFDVKYVVEEGGSKGEVSSEGGSEASA